MIFSLEALRAAHGDALLLHCGDGPKPNLYLIDGGWFNVYEDFLQPRLEQLRDGAPELTIRHLMVSHVDQDHIQGLLDMTKELRTRKKAGDPLPYRIRSIWHNAFDDIIGNGAKTLEAAGAASMEASSQSAIAALGIPVMQEAAFRLAGVGGGRTLRDDAKLLGIQVNPRGSKGLIKASSRTLRSPFTNGVDIRVVGPRPAQVEEFRKKWDAYLKKQKIKPREAGIELAAYLDKSAANLASIVALIRCKKKEILLTGDARGDFILQGMKSARLLNAKGQRHLEILKVPHHGSNRNVEVAFFKALPADHYVFSGDGEHGNPDVETFEMLFAARKSDRRKFTIHLTYDPAKYKPDSKSKKKYPLAKLRKLFKAQKEAGRKFDVRFPKAGELGLRIDLLDPYTGP